MIKVTNLCKTYGNQEVLKDITFDVGSGEIVCLLGPNGAGKSTLIKIISCFIPYTSGSVIVQGFDVSKDPLEVRKRIGYLPEKVQLYRDVTVARFLEFAARIKGVPQPFHKEHVDEIMDACGITHVADRHIRKLSKGYCQRVGVAQALLGDPPILLLDEPTVGLDPRQIVDIRGIIKEQSGKKTVIISTHILHEASMLCDTVMIITDGRIITKSTQEKLSDSIQGKPRLRIRIQGSKEAVLEDLRTAGYSVAVERSLSEEDMIYEYSAAVQDDTESRGNLARYISDRWNLLEMSRPAVTLEDVFMDVTSENDEVDL
jgi:ABC-2 type transport system ATP-binding protein